MVSRVPGVPAWHVSHTSRCRPALRSATATGDTTTADGGRAYTVAPEVPFHAIVHMAGFVGAAPAPVWDIADAYEPGDPRDLLVRNTRLGASLAAGFAGGRRLVLMRGHGFTAVSETGIEEVVFRGYYTANNARVETAALAIQHAVEGGAAANDSLVFLSPDEARDTEDYIRPTIPKPWDLWVRKVEVDPLYVNEA